LEALGAQIEATGGNAPVEADRLDAGRSGVRPGEEVGPLRVLMVAGGTGGHIFPALAVAQELRERSKHRQPGGRVCEILFLGTGRGLEARLIPSASFPLRTVAAAGLKGIGGWRKLRNLLVLPRSALETALVLRDFRPDVVVGIGGYLAGPAMLEAALKDIPTLLIEPNAVPGFTNRVLTPVVRLAAVAFEETANLYGAKGRLTGHAVRKAFSFVPRKEHVPPFTVLVLGGSQGSVAINECVVKSLPLLANGRERVRFIHQTGDRDYNAVRQAYQERGLTAEVHAFIENVPEAFARADLIVSRAGATAVAELAAAGKAALLIPFPSATDQHQLENARAMERAGAAGVIEQKDLNPEWLVKEVCELLADPARLLEMESNARGLARPDAASRIADLIEGLAVSRQSETTDH
jgi:UDP-N-acetylglucosamine--N-acetylmuramyl-(pentapeptide) pyrophosphoryl-undecaprenol N-acetylglucosamine transferase